MKDKVTVKLPLSLAEAAMQLVREKPQLGSVEDFVTAAIRKKVNQWLTRAEAEADGLQEIHGA